jgi:hypothetical protein
MKDILSLVAITVKNVNRAATYHIEFVSSTTISCAHIGLIYATAVVLKRPMVLLVVEINN